MKTTSDALFRFIKAMTKGEKTHFKKFIASTSPKKSSTNYIKLFDAISKQLEYDEATLLKKFRKETFVKNFVETKQHLKTQILKALRNYSPNKSITFQLKENLLDIELLMRKGIFDLARTQIKKSLKIAEKYELIHYIFELNKLYFKTTVILEDFKSVELYVTETLSREAEWLKKIENIEYHWQRYVLLYYNWKKYGPMEDKKSIPNLEDYPLDSFNATCLYYTRELNVGQLFNTPEVFYEDTATNYRLFKKYPNQVDLNPLSYLTAIVFYTLACSRVNRVEEGIEVIKEGISILKTMHQENKIITYYFVDYFIKIQKNQLDLYLLQGAKSSYKESYLSLKKEMFKYINIQSFIDVLDHWATIFSCEIILEDWESAETTYQELMNYQKRGHRTDMESIMRLLGIILYYETNNLELLEAAIDANYQFIRTKDFLFKFTRQFTNLFKHKIIKTINEKERIEHFKQFKVETLAFFEANPEEGQVLTYFDIIAWLDSKIEHISIHEASVKRLRLKLPSNT